MAVDNRRDFGGGIGKIETGFDGVVVRAVEGLIARVLESEVAAVDGCRLEKCATRPEVGDGVLGARRPDDEGREMVDGVRRKWRRGRG